MLAVCEVYENRLDMCSDLTGLGEYGGNGVRKLYILVVEGFMLRIS
jgi:hypothetical protein